MTVVAAPGYPRYTDQELSDVAANFDVHNPELQEDPHPLYAQLRARCPVARSDRNGGHYIVSRYDDMIGILQDPERFSSRGVLIPSWDFPLGGRQIPLEIDGEDHRMYRLAMAGLFGPGHINQLEPRMRDTARRLLAELSANGGGDMIAAYAGPLAAETFLHTFGLTPDVLPELLAYKNLLIHGGSTGREDLAAGTPSVVSLFTDLLERRKAEDATGPDVMSALLRARFGDRPLSDDEIVNISVVIMLASLDTTTAALGNMLAFLAEHPDHRRQLLDEPSLIPNAIEELLRYEGMASNGRLVTCPVTVHGTAMEPGDRVMMLYASAGRDQSRYEDPEVVDFRREAIRHLAFGAGPHRCLGMHLARRTLKVGIEELHAIAPDYALAPGVSPARALGHVRGILELQFRF